MTIHEAYNAVCNAKDAIGIIHHEGYDGDNAIEFGKIYATLAIMETVVATMWDIKMKFDKTAQDLHSKRIRT